LSDSGTEANLIIALNALRTNVSLANAMITTYTYKPLIGVSTITDPKGDKMSYEYDTLNRLKWVKDKAGNILSENQYHYKN
jgi:YD repeat-containing protein